MFFIPGNAYAEDTVLSGIDDDTQIEYSDEFPDIWEPVDIDVYKPDPDDPDRDGLLNIDEEYYNTDPDDPDSDNDGFTDGWEVSNGLDPNNSDTGDYLAVEDLNTDTEITPDLEEDDPDEDNLSNIGEYNNNTDPNNPDSDDDGLTDGWEVLNGLDPNNPDTDDDGLDDGWEVANGLDPKDPDMDNDGLTDGWEVANGTDPEDSDTDDDEMPDGWEVTYGTNPVQNDAGSDLDEDQYSNYVEYITETDPGDEYSSPTPGYYQKYDALGRMIKTAYLISYDFEYEIIYGYDSVGNRTSKEVR